MAVTIVATVGAASANSLASEADAQAYFNDRLNISPWAGITGVALTDDEKCALIMAGRILNRLWWKGERVDAVQAMSWPREGVVNPDDPDDTEFPTTGASSIPARVKRAQCEIALELLKKGTTDLEQLDATMAVREKTVDVLTTVYFEPWLRAQGLSRFPPALEDVSCLLDPAKIGGLSVVRV